MESSVLSVVELVDGYLGRTPSETNREIAMKVAEALMLRADLQKKLASLRERVARNAVVQDGEQPHEDPEALIGEAVAALEQLESLVCRVNLANTQNKLPDGRTLTEAIARRDALTQQHSLIQAAIAGSNKEPDRYSMSEIKWVATVDIAGLQKRSEDLAQRIRELNAQIQEANWNTDIE